MNALLDASGHAAGENSWSRRRLSNCQKASRAKGSNALRSQDRNNDRRGVKWQQH